MNKITSFTIDHTKLNEGIYISRIDKMADTVVTTFDIRMKRPNMNEYLSTTSAHTIEHIIATFLRNDEKYKDKTVYFGPMGCRTGFYVLFFGELTSEDILPLITKAFKFVADFSGDIPGQSEIECGNYRDLDLKEAKEDAKKFVDILEHITKDRLVYPE